MAHLEKSTKNRLQWVDSLRGLAALGVAIMHLYEKLRDYYPSVAFYQLDSIPGLLIKDFFNLGKMGVIVFFFISGYVIPFSLQNKDLNQFVKSRFFRLYPAYWISVILAVLVLGMPPLLQLFANATMFQKFFGIGDMVGVYWTLQIELIFYFICGVLFWKGLLYKNKAIVNGFCFFLIIALVVSIARYMTGIKLPVAAPLGLSVMFLGIVLRKYFEREAPFTGKQLITYTSYFVLVLLGICFLAYNRDYGHNEKWYLYFSSYTGAIVIFLIFSRFKWSNQYLVFLGSISYSLYLLHPVMGLGLVNYLRENYFPNLSSINYILLYFSFSIGSASLCYYFIEKPAVAFGKRVTFYRKVLSYNIKRK